MNIRDCSFFSNKQQIQAGDQTTSLMDNRFDLKEHVSESAS